MQILQNLTKHCDVGVYISDGAVPAVKDNVIDSSFFSGVFVESRARPNIVTNTFNGGSTPGDLTSSSLMPKGGIIIKTSDCGMIW